MGPFNNVYVSVPDIVSPVLLTLPAARSYADFTALAVAANVVLVLFVALESWTIPEAEVDADGSLAVATVPLLRLDAFREVRDAPEPENSVAVTVPVVPIVIKSVPEVKSELLLLVFCTRRVDVPSFTIEK